MGKGARNRGKRRQQQEQQGQIQPYDPTVYPPDQLDPDKIVSQLGAPIDGWTPELIFRFAILRRRALYVDWALMFDVYRIDEDDKTVRRRVERIDICHSEVHVHEFRQSDDPADDQGRRKVLMSILPVMKIKLVERMTSRWHC